MAIKMEDDFPTHTNVHSHASLGVRASREKDAARTSERLHFERRAKLCMKVSDPLFELLYEQPVIEEGRRPRKRRERGCRE